tara:strand:+ start:550 stop:1545 length:996 start_codon:yes stop_codon:yes gene_type:complete
MADFLKYIGKATKPATNVAQGESADKTSPATSAPATAPAPASRTKAAKAAQATQKGQEPRPPLRGDTFAPGTDEALVTQAPLSTTREMVQVSAPSEDVLQYLEEQGRYGHRQAPLGAATKKMDVPIGGYTIGDQKPPTEEVRRIEPTAQRRGFKGVASVGPRSRPQDVAARLMDPHPPRGQGGDSTLEGEGAIEEAFGMIDPIEFNVDGSLVGGYQGQGFPGPGIWTVGELSQHFDYLSIPVLRQYQGYLNRSLNEIDKADRKLADHAATLKLPESGFGVVLAQRELHRRRSATLREREAAIKQQQEQAQRLSALMKAMAKRAGVTDEELK